MFSFGGLLAIAMDDFTIVVVVDKSIPEILLVVLPGMMDG